MKLKMLEKKFTFSELEKECKKQGWRIPSIEELKGTVKLSTFVFVSDDTGEESRCYIYDGEKKHNVTKDMHLYSSIVIKENCKWRQSGPGKFHVQCAHTVISYAGQKNNYAPRDFNYCPYCGKEIEIVLVVK
ncbi:MAG TPA: hypothetical protein CFH81_08655 [Sulfurovum sp. UBA12169]|nr:MAG TPA: hypothetical protein CFH81_08655 [Sulfurovum sp. UBA12169]